MHLITVLFQLLCPRWEWKLTMRPVPMMLISYCMTGMGTERATLPQTAILSG